MNLDKKSHEAFEVVIDVLLEINKPEWSRSLKALKKGIEGTSDSLEVLRLKKQVGGLVRAGWGGVDDMSIPYDEDKDQAFFASIIILRKFSRTNFIDAVIARIIREMKS